MRRLGPTRCCPSTRIARHVVVHRGLVVAPATLAFAAPAGAVAHGGTPRLPDAEIFATNLGQAATRCGEREFVEAPAAQLHLRQAIR